MRLRVVLTSSFIIDWRNHHTLHLLPHAFPPRRSSYREKLDILISANYYKLKIYTTKWYTIDWKKLDELKRNSPLGQKCVSKDTNECIETTTLSCALPKNTSKNTPMTTTENKIKGFSSLENEEDKTLKDNKGFSFEKTGTPSKDEITNMMIDKAIKNLGCSEDDITETVKEVIQYYYSKYKDKVGKEHPIINQIAMNSVVDKLILGTDIITWFDFETYESMIDKHFETDYRNCDFNICHFISCDEIRNNRFYETCY